MDSNKTKVSSKWTSHIKDPKEKQRFVQDLKSTLAGESVRRLRYLIRQRMREIEREMTDFSASNWAHRMAKLVGEKEGLRQIDQLISNEKE